MRVILSSDAQVVLARHPKRQLLIAKIEQLADDPASLTNNVKRLVGRRESRLRVGDIRIIFAFRGDDLVVTAIASRGAVYD